MIESWKKVSTYLCVSLHLWKEKCERLDKELSRVWMQAECGAKATESKFTGTSNKTPVENCRNEKQDRYMVGGDLAKVDCLSQTAKYIMIFFHEMFQYTNVYTSELCKTDAWTLQGTTPRSPNLCSDDENIVRDWRKRFLETTSRIGEHSFNEHAHIRPWDILCFELSKTKTDNLLLESSFKTVPVKESKDSSIFRLCRSENELVGQCVTLSMCSEVEMSRKGRVLQSFSSP